MFILIIILQDQTAICLNRFEIKLLKYVWIIYLCVQGEDLGVFLCPLPYTHLLPLGLPQTPTLPLRSKSLPIHHSIK